MPQTGKEIKARLQSIRNTKKITKAMEMVAAAKMRRAVASALQTRAYHRHTWGIVDRLRERVQLDRQDILRRFFEDPPESGHTTILLMTSNRGLCGAFNSNVFKPVVEVISEQDLAVIDVVSVGRKGVEMLNQVGVPVHSAFPKDDTARSEESIHEVAQFLYQHFLDGKTDRVMVAYTLFESAIRQVPLLIQLFPFTEHPLIAASLESTASNHGSNGMRDDDVYLYEPGAHRVLEYLIPRVAEVELFQALLESNASEHSSRMLAMKNAHDAASDMGDELVLLFNRARQASITREIAEISAGSAALS